MPGDFEKLAAEKLAARRAGDVAGLSRACGTTLKRDGGRIALRVALPFLLTLLALVTACAGPSNGDAGKTDAGNDGGLTDSGYDGGPITLSSYGGTSIALNENTIFFANAEVGILSVPRSGGPTSVIYQKTNDYELPTDIALDAEAVYWTDFNLGHVMKVDLATKVATIVASTYQPLGLKLRNGTLYWASSIGLVGSISVDGSNEVTFATGVGTVPTELDVDDFAIYVTDLEGPTGNERIIRVDLDSGVASILASSQNDPTKIVVDDTSVYWGVGDDSGGEVHSISKDGGAVSVLASVPLAVAAIGLDAGVIYFTSFAHSEATIPMEGLFLLDRDQDIITILATDLYYPIDLAVASDGVYWTEQGQRIAKLP